MGDSSRASDRRVIACERPRGSLASERRLAAGLSSDLWLPRAGSFSESVDGLTYGMRITWSVTRATKQNLARSHTNCIGHHALV